MRLWHSQASCAYERARHNGCSAPRALRGSCPFSCGAGSGAAAAAIRCAGQQGVRSREPRQLALPSWSVLDPASYISSSVYLYSKLCTGSSDPGIFPNAVLEDSQGLYIMCTQFPCLVGGEALQVSETAAARAAEEARSGAWLEELESGWPLKALAPGMDQGVYGGWALPEQASGEMKLLMVWQQGVGLTLHGA